MFIFRDSTLSVIAITDISPGDELCFDYIDSQGLDFNERQDELLSRFYFTCLCNLCLSEKSK